MYEFCVVRPNRQPFSLKRCVFSQTMVNCIAVISAASLSLLVGIVLMFLFLLRIDWMVCPFPKSWIVGSRLQQKLSGQGCKKNLVVVTGPFKPRAHTSALIKNTLSQSHFSTPPRVFGRCGDPENHGLWRVIHTLSTTTTTNHELSKKNSTIFTNQEEEEEAAAKNRRRNTRMTDRPNGNAFFSSIINVVSLVSTLDRMRSSQIMFVALAAFVRTQLEVEHTQKRPNERRITKKKKRKNWAVIALIPATLVVSSSFHHQ